MQGAPDITLEKTPTGRGITLRPADFVTLVEALDYAAGARTGFNYYNAKGQVVDRLTYGEMRDQAVDAAGRLLALGLKPGDRVAMVAETNADFARIFLGALYAGMIPAPLPLPIAFGARDAYNDQLRLIVGVAGARAVFAPTELIEWVREAMAPMGLAFVGEPAELPAAAAAPERPNVRSDDLAYLQFSSGTTGAPKGVAVTHGSMMANLQAIAQHGIEIRDDDRGVTWLPLYHDMGLVGCFLTPIATQMSADNIATRDFIRRPLLWPQLMSDNRCSITYSPSFGYDLALRRARGRSPDGMDLSPWRIAGIGGDMIKAPILRAFAETFAGAGFRETSFVPSYGMAETTLALSFAPLGQGLKSERLSLDKLERDMVAAPADDGPARDFALCGPALPGHVIEIRDETGAVLPEGRVGRVFASGPSLMREYFGDPEQTAACLKDGWLDTGDLGYLREGQIVITGRAKDLMIVNGRNIWPQDIEWTIEHRVDGVREGGAAVFSVTPDDSGARIEEEVVIVVECRRRDPEERAAMRAAAHAAVREIHGVEARVALAGNGELPQTSSGKLSRAKARIMYLDGAFDTGG